MPGDPSDVEVWVDGRPVTCRPGASLFNSLMDAGVVVETACGGHGTCFLCRVTVAEGGEQLDAPTEVEERGLGNVLLTMGMRLTCQIPVVPGLHIQLPLYETREERKTRIREARKRRREGGKDPTKGGSGG